jgi:hypothetical protein
MLEAGYNYISAEVLLSLGGVLQRRKVTSCKHNNDGNTVGRAHDRPILDTRTYGIEFNDGTMTELMAYIIACTHNVTQRVISMYYLIALLTLKIFDSYFPCRPDDYCERTFLQALQHVWLEDLLPMEGWFHDMGVPQGPEGVSSTRDG